VPLKDALEQAREADLDLVEISPNVKPPVCKILDYGKFRFEKEKREREKYEKWK
jgi:translation initiation factor IF-3